MIFDSKKPANSQEVAKRVKLVSLWRNWQIVSLYLAVAISYIGFGIVAPLRTLYARAEGASGGEVGLMSAAYLLSAFIFLWPFGWLSDRVSRVGLIVGGLATHGLITLSFMWVTNGELFVALRFLEGVSSAAVLPASRALLADLVPKGRNGEAFGTLSAMQLFGIMAGPPVGTFLADGFGYVAAYLLAALVFVPSVVMVIVAFRHYEVDHPVVPSTERVAEAGWRSLLTGPILAGCLVRFALALGPSLGTSIWSLYMADLGYSLPMIGWTYTVFAIPALLVAPRAGRFSDRYGRVAMMLVGTLTVGFIWIGYGLINSFVLFIIVGTIEGAFISVAESANDGYLADLSPANARGRAQALFNGTFQFGNLTGAFVSGFLYESDHRLPFFMMGSAQVVVLIVAALWLGWLVYRRPARRSQVEL